MGVTCSQLVALLPLQLAEGSTCDYSASITSSACVTAALALGDHVSRAWRRLMAEFNSMIKSSRPAQDVLGLNLRNLELKYSLVLVVIGRLLSRLRLCDRTDAFAHVRAHMGGEQAAELRQSVIHASLVAYGAVMPLVEKNMVLFNDLVALAFAEKVIQVHFPMFASSLFFVSANPLWSFLSRTKVHSLPNGISACLRLSHTGL
jgi:hypothetical protein